jgi:TolA-binding protein
MSEQPEFANTYLALGNEYQKLGQTDNAQQTWQSGAAKFPNDSALQHKLTSAASPP